MNTTCATTWYGEPSTGSSTTANGNWGEAEGWLAQSSVQIIGWELNADARIELRKAIRRIIVGNLAVFDSLGIINVDLQCSDAEDLQSYNAPIYQVMGTMNCKAPVLVTAEADDLFVNNAMDAAGESAVVWASDYPHYDCSLPGLADEVRDRTDLSPKRLKKLAVDNAVEFFGIKVPKMKPRK